MNIPISQELFSISWIEQLPMNSPDILDIIENDQEEVNQQIAAAQIYLRANSAELAEQLILEERLADNVYIYHRETKSLEMVS